MYVSGAQVTDLQHKESILPIEKTVLWSDSTTVLNWIKPDSYRYKIFIGTRVAEIQDLTWQHTWQLCQFYQ